MFRIRRIGVVGLGVAIVACALLPRAASAQQSSGIAGVVKDTSGAVLPGVTVEAASPALIEKVRTVVTDGEGRYSIVDLRPGSYVVTFSLTGFSTVKREGIELPGGFTATVNSDMKVGALEETITVSGSAPLVDTANVRAQAAVSAQMLEALPSGSKSFGSLAVLVPGLNYQSGASVSGSKGIFQMAQTGTSTYHGKAGSWTKFDGMGVNSPHSGTGAVGYVPNAFTAEEMRVETGGISAESNTATASFDMIPKEGGNSFKTLFYGHYAGSGMQASNLDDKLRSRGLTNVTEASYLVDSAMSLGGPIRKNKLWFFTAHRGMADKVFQPGVFFNKTQGTPFYTPDLDRRGYTNDWMRSNAVRLTWQFSSKNKLNLFGDNQNHCACRNPGNNAPEAAGNFHFNPQGLYQATWNSPVTNRLLLEAAGSVMRGTWSIHPQDELTPNLPVTNPIIDQLSGFRYNSPASFGKAYSLKVVQRASVSYVTGSHAFKTGMYIEEGSNPHESINYGSMIWQFRGTTPVFIDQYAYPYEAVSKLKADLGLYAQDQWTLKRLTLNLGLRFDYFNTYAPAQTADAGPWVPARNFAPVPDIPNWKSLNPRLGAAYDLFGDGRTALKVSLGRYNGVTGVATFAIAEAANPFNTTVNSVRRTWNDANHNYVPDCDLRNFAANGECGAISDQNFGKLNPRATTFSDEVLHGWNVRDYSWDITTEVQHQIGPNLSVKGGYYRNSGGNFFYGAPSPTGGAPTFTPRNLAVNPSDFSPYCVTAPTAPANGSTLPGGGGYQVCGLYDVSPAKFGQVTNVLLPSKTFGNQSLVNHFINLSLNGRLPRGVQIGGGLDTGRTISDHCFVINSPQELLYCREVIPFRGQTQIKLFGSIPLPADIVVSGNFTNVSGPMILADYPATNAEVKPTLGRNLASCGTQAVCTATATAPTGYPVPGQNAVPLIEPGTQFDNRITGVDLRLSKIIKLGPKMRLQANVDLYNVFNGSGVQSLTTAFGSRWLLPIQIQDARLLQVGGQLTF